MILRTLDLKEFRGFREEQIDLDAHLTVIVGANGAGKSSVLDAVSILLDQYSSRLLDLRSSAKRLSPTDGRLGAKDTLIRLTIDDGTGGEVRWALRKQGAKQRLLKPIGSELAGLNDYVRTIVDRVPDETDYLADAALPIYYDQRRALAEVPQRKRAAAKHSARDAFIESRGKAGLDFRGFVYWFQERETEELRRQRGKRSYEDPQLAGVRRAVADATGLTGLSYRPIPPRGLMVNKQGIELRVDQLSTGERVFLAMAGDLARRLAMLAGDDPRGLLKRAIVLIDEVELHLHPTWQRKILPWMLRAFPRCQFIVTTHSPQVIGDIEARHIRVLEFSGKGNQVHTVAASKGRDSNYLLLSVFGAAERSKSTKDILTKFESTLKMGDLRKAEAELRKLEDHMEGSPPEVSIAQARLARRRASSS
jgi:predicted ATP-binding protein involved in virulence